MAICSIYIGWLYNEFYALPTFLSRSRWMVIPTSQFMVPVPNSTTYPFGVDPAWKVSANELAFYNSLKMKISIVIAYLHMMLGIVMHAFNAVHFRRWYDLWFEFIPRALFLSCIIGYMVLLIMWKWLTPWDSINPFPPNQTGNGASAAPMIISIIISMFLSPGNVPRPVEFAAFFFFFFLPLCMFTICRKLCEHMLGCPTQSYVQLFLLLVAVGCVPVMLFAKPLLLRRDHAAGRLHGGYTHGHAFEFSEVLVHQIIETIEFVLGAISNTASYLRLWALSLAHSELSIGAT